MTEGFRLTWSPTWPEKAAHSHADFVAKDPANPRAYCRIYKATSRADLGWYWCAADTHDLGHGYEPTARKAAEKAEAVYFAGSAGLCGRV